MKRLTVTPGSLYVVATPIGNFADISSRAVEVLRTVDGVYAEDTRTSQSLFREIGCRPEAQSLHEHNELERAAQVVKRLQAGESLALISDAGTPLISDPGFRVVGACHDAGIAVVPVPGACAATSALSVSGLPTDRFSFEGFLPAKSGPRQARLDVLSRWPHTVVFYESPHRIEATLHDLALVFGAGRPAAMARELTKQFETVRRATLGELALWVSEDSNQRRGEVVLVVQGRTERVDEVAVTVEVDELLRLLAAELPPKKAAAVVSQLSGRDKRELYKQLVSARAGGTDLSE